MSCNDLLSQDEIDALLHGVDSGDIEIAADRFAPGEAVPCDFASQGSVVHGHMPALEMINERIARLFHVTLADMLRRTPQITASGIQTMTFSDYANSLFVPASLNLTRVPPLQGTSLVVFDPGLVFSAVESFFGGDGRFQARIEDREFTQAELRVVHMMLEGLYTGMAEAWAPVMEVEFEYLNSEVNPHFTNIAAPTEMVIVSTFHIELESGGGDLHVTMPYTMLEPIRELLNTGFQGEPAERDEHWVRALQRDVGQADVELVVELADAGLTVGEIIELRPGDIIPVNIPEFLTVKAEGVPLFEARHGIYRGNMAVQLVRPVKNDL